MTDLKMQKRDSRKDEIISLLDEKIKREFSIASICDVLEIKKNFHSPERISSEKSLNPSDLKTQNTPILPKNNDKLEQAVLLGMKEKLANFSERSNKPILDFILQQINNAEHKDITYQACIDRICLKISEILNNLTQEKKNGLSLKTAWLLWKHLTPERIQFHYQPPSHNNNQGPSITALHLMQVGKMANQVVNKLLYKGGSTDIKKSRSHSEEIQRQMDSMEIMYQQKYRACLKYLNPSSNNFDRNANFLSLAIATQLAETFNMGNCYEKSIVLVNFLRKLGESFTKNSAINVEVIAMHSDDGEADHTFVLVGRKKNSDLNDYTTWGNDVVIFDPWLDTVFFPTEIQDQLKSHIPGGGTRGFHPFKYRLFCPHPDCLTGMKQGMNLLHTYDENLALNHAITTLNMDLATAAISHIVAHSQSQTVLHVMDLISSCDQAFETPCFNHLVKTIITMNRMDMLSILMKMFENIDEILISDEETVIEFAQRMNRHEIVLLLENTSTEGLSDTTSSIETSVQEKKPEATLRLQEAGLIEIEEGKLKASNLVLDDGLITFKRQETTSDNKLFQKTNINSFLNTTRSTPLLISQDKIPTTPASFTSVGLADTNQ